MYTKGDIAGWMIDQVAGGYNVGVRDSSVRPCLWKRIARVGAEISTTRRREDSIPESEWHANAKLIAAAPELLQISRDCLTFCRGLVGEHPVAKKVLVPKLQAIIDKATK